MFAALSQFQVLVMQAPDRLSRGDDGFAELTRIAKTGVEIWFYADQRRFDHKTMVGRVDGFLRAEFAAEFRRAIAQKTTEAMLKKARDGHVTGGRTFGYDHVRQHGHVDRVINETEAAVVRDIYQRYAKGAGFKQIAHTLNAQGVPSPRAQRGRPTGWDPGTIRAVLRRSIYRGVVVYNKTKKRADDGSRHRGRQPKKPHDQVLTVDAPQLRLIETAVIAEVDARLGAKRDAYLRDAKGHLLGSPRRHGHGQITHLLAGFMVCPCGATFEAVSMIRSRGHHPKGGYDGQNGIRQARATGPAAVHGRV